MCEQERQQERGRPARRWPAVVLAGAALLSSGAAPASAHDALVSTTPADGGTVPTPPTSVVLTFEEPPLSLGAQVVVTGPDGAVVSTGAPQLAQDSVTEQLTGALPAGRYTVAWRVTSDDGHPVSGTSSYTAAAAAAGPSPAPSATPSAAPSTSVAAAPRASTPPPGHHAAASSGSAPAAWLPWAVAVAVVAPVVAAVLRRRRAGRA